jgi:hypothetical protein
LILENESVFEGGFRNSLFHGEGLFRDRNHETVLKGKWELGNFTSGELKYSTGFRITFNTITKRGALKYYAEMELSNKISYKGELLDNGGKGVAWVIDGEGLMEFPDGSRCEGEWCKGMMNGFGKYTWPNGDYY